MSVVRPQSNTLHRVAMVNVADPPPTRRLMPGVSCTQKVMAGYPSRDFSPSPCAGRSKFAA